MAIFKKRGQWWIGYRGADGKRRREPTGTTKHKLASEVLAKRKNEVAEGKHFAARVANRQTFNVVIDEWLSLHGSAVRSRTWADYLRPDGDIRRELGARPVGTLNAGDIQRVYNAIFARSKLRAQARGEEASPANANRVLTLIRSIINKARLAGSFHGTNPCDGVKRQAEPAGRIRFLSRDEMTALLDASDPRLLPFLKLALLTGMRKSEMLALKWEDVSLERGTLFVAKSKSGRSRDIPMAPELRATLEALGPKPSGPVIEVPAITLRRCFEAAVRAAKLPTKGADKVTMHTTRHTFASWFIMRTGDVVRLQRLLGHASLSMTMRYSHLSPSHLAEGMDRFASAIPCATRPALPAPAAASSAVIPATALPA